MPTSLLNNAEALPQAGAGQHDQAAIKPGGDYPFAVGRTFVEIAIP